jgi:flagellar basal-body rod modification protein FlgD
VSNSVGEALDLINRYKTATPTAAATGTLSTQSNRRGKDTPSNELSFTDMLELMVLQFQNQTIDNTADTSDMMNQLVQMSVVQAMTAMSTQMEQLYKTNAMAYSASLVGKEVTVGVPGKDGKLEEIVGVVTATGTYDGNQIIFVGSKSYPLSSVLAVGRLPEEPSKDMGGVTDDPDASGDGTGGKKAAAVNDSTAGQDWYGQPTVG